MINCLNQQVRTICQRIFLKYDLAFNICHRPFDSMTFVLGSFMYLQISKFDFNSPIVVKSAHFFKNLIGAQFKVRKGVRLSRVKDITILVPPILQLYCIRVKLQQKACSDHQHYKIYTQGHADRPWILRDKTMGNKLMYNPNDDKQRYPLCRSKSLIDKFEHCKFDFNSFYDIR